jgi:ABC-type multidrug transport system fused ATPase/permease subunit
VTRRVPVPPQSPDAGVPGPVPAGCRRHALLLCELLQLSWRRVPGLVTLQFAVQVAEIAAAAAAAMGMRDVVDDAVHRDAYAAMAAALVAALGGALYMACSAVLGITTIAAIEKVGLTDLNAQIYGDISALQGLEHLEDIAFLNRFTLVRGGAWALMFGLWSVVRLTFIILQLMIMLCMLSSVSPWVLALVPLMALPLGFELRGKLGVAAAETGTAELTRIQRYLFDLGCAPASGGEIRLAGASPELVRRQREAWDQMVEHRYRARVQAAGWKLAGWSLFAAGFGGALALAIRCTAQGQGGMGGVVLTITITASLRQALQTTVAHSGGAIMAARLVAPYLWLRDYTHAACKEMSGSHVSPDRLTHGITFQQVDYVHPRTGQLALDDISFHMPAGSVVAVVGDHGSGKTTLVKLLSKFYRPTSGTVCVDGGNLAEINTDEWRARLVAVFQDFGRFDALFSENVGLGDLSHLSDHSMIYKAVREANADGLLERLPRGLATPLGSGGVALSEGQWQKTALARGAMRQDPLLLILDEPTASLDAPSEREVFRPGQSP